MGKKSAGILLYRFKNKNIEVMLAHPGGPFWAKKDDAVWTIPKGEFDDDEEALVAAKREFEEELGRKASAKNFIELEPVKTKNKKTVFAFAAEEDFDTTNIKSNLCWVDWPPRSGKRVEIPEVDRGEWFSFDRARRFIRAEQLPLLEALRSLLT